MTTKTKTRAMTSAEFANCDLHSSIHLERIGEAIKQRDELIVVLSDLVNSPNAKSNALWDRARTALADADQGPTKGHRPCLEPSP